MQFPAANISARCSGSGSSLGPAAAAASRRQLVVSQEGLRVVGKRRLVQVCVG